MSQISVKSRHTTLFSFSAFTLLNSIQKIIFSLQRRLQRPLVPLYPHQQAALYDTFYHNNDDDIRTLGEDLVGLLIYFHSMLFRSLINSPRLLRRMVTGSSQESPNSVRCEYMFLHVVDIKGYLSSGTGSENVQIYISGRQLTLDNILLIILKGFVTKTKNWKQNSKHALW